MAEDTSFRPIDEMSFKEASIELEQIVRSLENGDLELEESLERYGRGVALLTSLRQRLSEAEQKVQVLIAQADATDSVLDTTAAPSVAFIDE